uniref:SFRICE_027429 n=1 Tax=Spodoptera frugiperda TaxID=7108 RepID=A0A2H1VVD6_SPOFR
MLSAYSHLLTATQVAVRQSPRRVSRNAAHEYELLAWLGTSGAANNVKGYRGSGSKQEKEREPDHYPLVLLEYTFENS